MASLIKDILDDVSRDVKFDEVLSKRIARYKGDLMNRSEATVMFFGSNLTGVYPLRFKTADRNEWFIDIKDIDEFEIDRRVLALSREKDSGIEESWVRATDAYNLDTLYTIHRFMNSGLPANKVKQTIEDIAMVLNIKLLGSIMAIYFKHDVDERIAQEVYARLSRKFYIKKFGNWRKVLEHRSEDICSPHSKWYSVLKDFTSNADIAQCISDIQGRLRSMIKFIWKVLDEVRQDDAKFNRTSMAIETGGEKIIQDLKRDPDIYKRYINKMVLDKTSFVKPELMSIVVAEMRTMPEKLLYDVLDHVSLKSNTLSMRQKKDETQSGDIETLLNNCVEFTTLAIAEDRSSARYISDLAWLLNKVRLLVTAAKTKDPLVFAIRDTTEQLVRESAKTKNPTIIATLKTGLTLYIVARAFTMRNYS